MIKSDIKVVKKRTRLHDMAIVVVYQQGGLTIQNGKITCISEKGINVNLGGPTVFVKWPNVIEIQPTDD